MTEEKEAVYVPKSLYKAVEERIMDSEFNSPDEYVTFLLEEVLKHEDEQGAPWSLEDDEEVKDRLRALGYLD